MIFSAESSQEPTETVTTTNKAEQSGGIPIVTIVAATCGGIIGVLATVIACICVWCIARSNVHIHISCYKERSKPDTDKHSNIISVQQNAAYQQTAQPTDAKTVMELPEEAMQLNLAYGVRGEICKGMETGSQTGEEYEYTDHDHFGPTVREPEKFSNLAMPMERN